MPRPSSFGDDISLFGRKGIQPVRLEKTGIPEAGQITNMRFRFAGIWLGPLILLTSLSGPGAILSDIGWFFSKLAVVTFGGAYAVLAYMGQDVVTAYGWLDAGQMMDGLGLAETTPGPLILVTEFVGYLAAYRLTLQKLLRQRIIFFDSLQTEFFLP